MDDKDKLAHIEKENELLRQKLEKLSDFIENGSLPLHWVDGNGIIIWANQAELDLLGYTKEEYIGTPVSIHHKDASVIQDILNRLVNNETLRDFPAVLKCKDGSDKYVTINSNALFRDDVFIHSRCFTKDVTSLVKEEKRKNKLLRLLEESEERLRLAVQATNLGTWDWDYETGKIFFSDQAMKILGIGFELLNYEDVLNLILADDQRHVNQIIRNLRDNKASRQFDFECRIQKHDQALIWIKAQGSTFFSPEKRLRRIIGAMVDVTDIKDAEAKNAELAAIVNSSNDAIVGKTLKGQITSWNLAAEELFGYTANEIIGHPVLQLIPEDRKSEEDYIIEELKAGKSIKHFETKRQTKNGNLIDVSLTISPIKNDEGVIFGVSKIARNITQKKQEERRKNDFVSMVSHELKTPLTSILLYSQVLQRRYKALPEEIDYQISSKIEMQTTKMVSMIHDFLSLARIEEGKLQIRKETFSLLDLFEDTRNEAELITINHSLKVDCDENIKVSADRDKIGQVMTNLVSNAIKYSPAGGQVNIGCTLVDGKVQIYVTDQGVGISDSDQKKLFERFYRVDNEEVANVGGFGIGLYIVAEILRLHQSTIVVESEKGVGTTFKFYLEQ